MSEALWTELEKMDVLRERMGIGYEEARTALKLAEGDVVKALDNLEKAKYGDQLGWELGEKGQRIWDSLKEKLGGFNNTTLSLKKHNTAIVSISAPLGLALGYTIWRRPGLRMLALVGAVGAAINHYELEVSNNKKTVYEDYAFNFTPDKGY